MTWPTLPVVASSLKPLLFILCMLHRQHCNGNALRFLYSKCVLFCRFTEEAKILRDRIALVCRNWSEWFGCWKRGERLHTWTQVENPLTLLLKSLRKEEVIQHVYWHEISTFIFPLSCSESTDQQRHDTENRKRSLNKLSIPQHDGRRKSSNCDMSGAAEQTDICIHSEWFTAGKYYRRYIWKQDLWELKHLWSQTFCISPLTCQVLESFNLKRHNLNV